MSDRAVIDAGDGNNNITVSSAAYGLNASSVLTGTGDDSISITGNTAMSGNSLISTGASDDYVSALTKR